MSPCQTIQTTTNQANFIAFSCKQYVCSTAVLKFVNIWQHPENSQKQHWRRTWHKSVQEPNFRNFLGTSLEDFFSKESMRIVKISLKKVFGKS